FDVVRQLRVFPVLEAEPIQRLGRAVAGRFQRIFVADRGRRDERIDDAVLAGFEVDEVRARDRQREDPLVEAVVIDRDRRGRRGGRGFGAFVGPLLVLVRILVAGVRERAAALVGSGILLVA